MHLGADECSQIVHLGLALWEQIGERRIGVLSVVIVLEMFQGRVSASWISQCQSTKSSLCFDHHVFLMSFIPLSFIVPDWQVVRKRRWGLLDRSFGLGLGFVSVPDDILLIVS